MLLGYSDAVKGGDLSNCLLSLFMAESCFHTMDNGPQPERMFGLSPVTLSLFKSTYQYY